METGVDFDPPKTGLASKIENSKFGQWIGRTQRRFQTKISNLKSKFNIRFDSIKKFATKFKKGLTIGANLAMAGQFIVNYRGLWITLFLLLWIF